MTRSKFGNVRVERDGHVFDSGAEYSRYLALRDMQEHDEIELLMLQPRYLLQEKFQRGGKSYAAIHYVGDFLYGERSSGLIVCEDVKGVRTAVFNVKWKLALARYPNVDFRIVKS